MIRRVLVVVAVAVAACSSNQPAIPTTPGPAVSPTVPAPTIPTATLQPVAPRDVLTEPEPTSPSAPSAGAPSSSGPRFDYEITARLEKTSETPLGRISWYKTSVVPSEWLYSGFPTPSFVADPFSYDRTWARVAQGADCCLTVTRTDTGWVGIGPEDGSGNASCNRSLAVWASVDGVSWRVAHSDPFGESGPCTARGLVEHGGSAAFFGDAAGGPAIWVSHGMEHWLRTELDFDEVGTDTFVTSVVAGADGFVIFGMRVSHEPSARSETGIRLGPYPFEWVGWLSPDGREWRRVNMAEMFGQPWCRPNHPNPCGYIDATMTDDGIVAYLHQQSDSTVPDLRDGWALWIGLID